MLYYSIKYFKKYNCNHAYNVNYPKELLPIDLYHLLLKNYQSGIIAKLTLIYNLLYDTNKKPEEKIFRLFYNRA